MMLMRSLGFLRPGEDQWIRSLLFLMGLWEFGGAFGVFLGLSSIANSKLALCTCWFPAWIMTKRMRS